ncbi:CK1/TTBKL protein kinase [Aphelenchoides avenae]|nr:CK1/TTBKL protein kinase [Aphelenchus avenae]
MENSEDEAPFDLREGQVIAKRWVVAEELGKGSCGKVYRVHDVNNRRKRAALKIELIDDNTPSVLKQEVQVLQKLQSRKHVIDLVKYGKKAQYNYIIITLCGKNLSELAQLNDLELLSAGTVCRLGIHALYSLKQLHEVGYIHRDVKPKNLVLGRGVNARMVYLIDFGMAREYVIRDGQTVRHRKPRRKTLLRGTVRYCSPHVHAREEQSRRDDMWSLAYVLVELHAGLPWQGKKEEDAYKMKREVRDEVLTAYCPPEWTMILKHVRKLEFDERPDYRHVYDLLLKAMTRLKVSFTEPYEWENAKRLSNGSASSTSSIGKKKSSAQSKNDKATKAASAEKTKLKETSAEPSEAPADSETPPTAAPEEFARNDIGI